MYLATFLNGNGYQANIADLASVLKENWSGLIPQADVYGFDTYSSTYYRTLEILQVAKRINPAAITIAAGPHASPLPQQVAHDFDFVIVGEGERCLLVLLNSLNKGERLDSIHPLSRYNEIIEVLRAILRNPIAPLSKLLQL